jgi:hypothetical protein
MNTQRALELIGRSTDPEELRRWQANATRLGQQDVANAAFRRLVTIEPREQPGTVEYEPWRTVYAIEQIRLEERGKKVLMGRTRRMIEDRGEIATLKNWCTRTVDTDGFETLIARGMADLTGEAIVLRHPEIFDDNDRAGARYRLERAGVDVDALLTTTA